MDQASIQVILEAKKLELQTRLASASKDLGKQYSQDFAEQATERENDEVLLGIRAETEDELGKVNLALKQMQSGNYGNCIQCGSAIDPRRLSIMPYATECTDCAK